MGLRKETSNQFLVPKFHDFEVKYGGINSELKNYIYLFISGNMKEKFE